MPDAPRRTSRRAVGEPLTDAIASFARALKAENKSPQTVERVYVPRLRQFSSWLESQGMPTTLEGIKREHIETYVLWLQTVAVGRKTTAPGLMPATVSISYRTLRGFFNWTVREDLLPRSPMDKMRAPSVPVEPPAILTDDEVRRLLRACEGKHFDDRRDMALIRFLLDSGARRGEVASLRVEDLDWDMGVVHIGAEASKSKRGRAAPFGRKTAQAFDRYLRERNRHSHADAPWLWLGKRGRLTDSGILQVVERRGNAAGIPGLHPHRFRHQFAHSMKADGFATEDLMRLGGWRDPGSLARYGHSAADERALAAYRNRAPGDRLG